MARIRSIHPGIFTDEAFVSVRAEARILFIGLWCESDDQGIFEWKPLTIKMRIFPANEADVAGMLDELKAAGMIIKYEAEGRVLGAVRNFCRFQRPKSPKNVFPTTPAVNQFVSAEVEQGEPMSFTRDATATERKRLQRQRERDQTGTDGDQSGNCHVTTVTSTEVSRQMEDGGWRMEDGEEKKEEDKPPLRVVSSTPIFFEAGKIRLTETDHAKWVKAYPSINLDAELYALAEWAGKQPSWFNAVSGALAKKDREARLAIERVKAEATAGANGRNAEFEHRKKMQAWL